MKLPCRSNVKYFFSIYSLYQFCKLININYYDITKSIRYYLNKGNVLNDCLIIKIVNKYLKRQEYRNNNLIINDVINNKINVNLVACKLNIRRQDVYVLMQEGFSKKEAILIIYFLYDSYKKYKHISKKKIEKMKTELFTKNYSTDFINLLCYYYIGYDVENLFFNNVYYFLKRIIIKTSYSYNLNIYNYVEDIISELNIKVIFLLRNQKLVMDNDKKLKRYLYKSIIHDINQSFMAIEKAEKEKHLEDKIFEGKELIDFIKV